ncbi:MAG: 4Fe-4S binding protein [Candidatus Sumerlaeia bacterium]|nr:4Fe-4S binding protein [Candidatus Sumerlaeia bacterium]
MASRKMVLHFPPQLIDQPIISRLVKDYGLEFNILRAYVTPQEEGLMVLELAGDIQQLDSGLNFLSQLGVSIQPLTKDVRRDDQRCTQCSFCVTICPTGALYLDPETLITNFDAEKCIACELCVPTCPPRAMFVKF